MGSYDDLFCKIFIDTNLEKNEMIDIIVKLTEGNIKKRLSFTMIETKHLDIEFVENEDFSEQMRSDKEKGFLYSRYYLEVEPIDGTDEKVYIDCIADLIVKIKDRHCNIVAACDFEEELPDSGYYYDLVI